MVQIYFPSNTAHALASLVRDSFPIVYIEASIPPAARGKHRTWLPASITAWFGTTQGSWRKTKDLGHMGFSINRSELARYESS
jgi:hypothetical protein